MVHNDQERFSLPMLQVLQLGEMSHPHSLSRTMHGSRVLQIMQVDSGSRTEHRQYLDRLLQVINGEIAETLL